MYMAAQLSEQESDSSDASALSRDQERITLC